MIEYKYQGETFLLDDSEGCYIKITYRGEDYDLIGYAGIASQEGTKDQPYSVVFSNPNNATADGFLRRSDDIYSTIEEAIDSFCEITVVDIKRRNEEAAKQKLDKAAREEACELIHKFMNEHRRK